MPPMPPPTRQTPDKCVCLLVVGRRRRTVIPARVSATSLGTRPSPQLLQNMLPYDYYTALLPVQYYGPSHMPASIQ